MHRWMRAGHRCPSVCWTAAWTLLRAPSVSPLDSACKQAAVWARARRRGSDGTCSCVTVAVAAYFRVRGTYELPACAFPLLAGPRRRAEMAQRLADVAIRIDDADVVLVHLRREHRLRPGRDGIIWQPASEARRQFRGMPQAVISPRELPANSEFGPLAAVSRTGRGPAASRRHGTRAHRRRPARA
jgi:hypothetical protein